MSQPLRRRRVYLDWNASAPLAVESAEAMSAAISAMSSEGLNPSSQHVAGRTARGLIERARGEVAALADCAPSELIFTGSASEAAATALAQGWEQIFVSSIEHDCIRGPAAATGAEIITLPATAEGVIEPDAVARALKAAPPADRRLVAVMAANNETGALQPAAEIVALTRDLGAATLVDMAQAVGKTDASFRQIGADMAILSGHKIQGPTGIGALLLSEDSPVARSFRPLLAGGGQEMRRRAGTENVIGIVGMGAAAAALNRPERREAWLQAAKRRDRFEAALKNEAEGLVFFADAVNRLPATSCVAIPGLRAEMQLMQLDLAGFAVSAGSACSSGKMAASHVLSAMGAGEDLAASAIRVSFGPETAEADLEAFVETFGAMAARLR